MAKKNKQTAGSNKFNLFSKLFSQTGNPDTDTDENPAAKEPQSGLPQFKLVFFIVDWNRVKAISGVFETENVAFHFINKGKGTASSEILDLLGIGASDKAVILCLCRAEPVQPLMKEVRKKLNFHSPGAGIAFAVPLSAINNPVLRIVGQLDEVIKSAEVQAGQSLADSADAPPQDNNERRSGKDRRSGYDRRSGQDRRGGHDRRGAEVKPGHLSSEFTHDLIISVVNQGYSDELMNVAREAGAFGGTVLNARGQAHEGAVRFLGISVQDEKEIVLILSTREKKTPIMQAVSGGCGIDSKAQGIVLSLPVENVMGLSFE